MVNEMQIKALDQVWCQRDYLRAAGQMQKAETNRAYTTRQARPLSQAPDSELRVRPRSIAWYKTAQPPA